MNFKINKAALINKLQDIEWEDFEVKEAKTDVPKNAWETVSAFSNTSGGWLAFGVKKSGKDYILQGIENPEKIEQDFLTTLNGKKFNKKISVQCRKYKFDKNITVLCFYIPSASAKDKPVYFNSIENTFIRTGSGDQRATKEEIDAMYRNSSFEQKDRETTHFTMDALDKETVKQYRTYLENINPEHRYNKLPEEKFLEKLQVLKNGKVTIGGLLIFGNEDKINNLITDFRIDYLEILGTSYTDAPTRYQYRLPQEENVFNYYFSIFERIIKKIDIPFKLKGSFRDENQAQVAAIREALVNLLMHTDYFSNAKPRIRIFLDRIEFFNPGALPKDIKYIIKEDFSLPRNPTIAKIFRIINLSENIGSGFHKMIEGWKSYYNSKPEITGDFNNYKIIFPFDSKMTGNKVPEKVGVKVGERVGVKVGEKLTDNQKKILENIKQNPYITAKMLSNILNISSRKIEENIAKLKEKRFLKRIGPDKSGHWEVIK